MRPDLRGRRERPSHSGIRRRSVAIAGVVVGLLVGVPGSESVAQPVPGAAQPTAADRKAAGAKFSEGERAFDAGDFVAAAAAFEGAYRLAPHPSASWNAARARERAGQTVRAANLYARYLREAPADASDRPHATQSLAALSATLGRIEISAAADVTEIAVDGERIEDETVYVAPGTHVVRGTVSGRAVMKETPPVAAGATLTVALADDAAPAPATAPSASAPAAAPTAAPTQDAPPPLAPPRSGWHPAVAIVSGSASLLIGAWGVWAGVRTLEQKETYDALVADPSSPTYDPKEADAALEEGRKRQAFTNILFTLSITGALFSIVTAVALTDWGPDAPETKKRAVSFGLGPGSAALHGSF